MNEELRNNIAFAQTVVSLGRDLILIVIVLFAILIVYLGGDPNRLTELDWAILIGGAMFVVIAPVLGFYFMVLAAWLVDKLMTPNLYLWGETSKVPRGLFLIWYIRIKKYSLKKYVTKWEVYRSNVQKKILEKPRYRFYKKIGFTVHKFIPWLWNAMRYVYATLFLLMGVLVFYGRLAEYIKP